MSNNTELWDKLGKTDPKHTKTFKRAGGFSGTAIKPMFSYRRMTEEFGPCGTGWGINAPSFTTVNGAEGEVLVFCTVSIWHGEQGHVVFGVGGDKVVGKNKYGLTGDDEAFKKAFTDAITNALKLIGVGADVHMGMFDDNKYVNTMKEEFSEPEPANAPSKPKSSAQLKREDQWAELTDRAHQDMLDIKGVIGLNTLWKDYIAEANDNGWTVGWKDALADIFAAKKAEILAQQEETGEAA